MTAMQCYLPSFRGVCLSGDQTRFQEASETNIGTDVPNKKFPPASVGSDINTVFQSFTKSLPPHVVVL